MQDARPLLITVHRAHTAYPASVESVRRVNCDQMSVVGPDATGIPFVDITHKYNYARQVFLDHVEYTHALFVEDDMVVPQDCAERLLRVGADVVYGLYWLRGLRRANIALYIDLEKAIWLSDMLDAWRLAWGNILHCAGTGLGCTLVARPVLERLSFWCTPQLSCDVAFACDCAGVFEAWADLGCVCGHIDLDRQSILWPDRDRLMVEQPLPELDRAVLAAQ